MAWLCLCHVSQHLLASPGLSGLAVLVVLFSACGLTLPLPRQLTGATATAVVAVTPSPSSIPTAVIVAVKALF